MHFVAVAVAEGGADKKIAGLGLISDLQFGSW